MYSRLGSIFTKWDWTYWNKAMVPILLYLKKSVLSYLLYAIFYTMPNFTWKIPKEFVKLQWNNGSLFPERQNILASHCNCVARLGKVCTHIASILFAFEFTSTREKENVTHVLAYRFGPYKKDSFYKSWQKLISQHQQVFSREEDPLLNL